VYRALSCAVCCLLLSLAAAAQERKPGHLRMALVNLKCLTTDGLEEKDNAKALMANAERHLYFIDRAAKQGAEFIGFPELSLNGYSFSKNTTWIKIDEDGLVNAIAQRAKERGVYVSIGVAEVDKDGKKWNTQLVIGPDGTIVGKHRKIWLTAEKGHTEKGTAHEVFAVKGMKVGICTCADGTDYKQPESASR